MKKRGLNYHYFKNRDEFLMIRKGLQNGEMVRLGGSDIGTAMGYNEFKAPWKLFYELIGLKGNDWRDNLRVNRGVQSEDHIVRNYWIYADPAEPISNERQQQEEVQRFIKRSLAGKPLRKARAINAIITNDAYPWLHSSLDYEIVCDPRGVGILECKIPQSYVLEKYEGGIPKSNVVQLYQQMIVARRAWGEVFQLIDGYMPYTNQFELQDDLDLAEQILNETCQFCELATKARDLVGQCQDEGMTLEQIETELETQSLIPEPDDPLRFEQFIKDKFKTGGSGVMEGDEELLKVVGQYIDLKKESSAVEMEVNRCKGILKKAMYDAGQASVMHFPGLGDLNNKGNGLRPSKELENNMKLLKDGTEKAREQTAHS